MNERTVDDLRKEAERLSAQGEYRAANDVWMRVIEAQSAEIVATCGEIVRGLTAPTLPLDLSHNSQCKKERFHDGI